jgi:hypothetical protein
MRTEDGKWYIEDDGSVKIYDNSYDAWQYVFLMRIIKPNPPIPPRSTYPVLTLDPTRSITFKKKVVVEVLV